MSTIGTGKIPCLQMSANLDGIDGFFDYFDYFREYTSEFLQVLFYVLDSGRKK